MAQFDTSGIKELINQMQRMGLGISDVATEMCSAAAEEIKEGWKKSAEEHGFHVTGAMINSIGYPEGPVDIGGIKCVDVYPQGKDARGVRNAEKAFILHYGSSRIPASYWTDQGNHYAEQTIPGILQGIWEKYIASNS